MEKKPIEIKVDDLSDDISALDKDTIIVLDDRDEMQDDDFWED